MLLGYLEYARRTHKCTRKVWVGAGMWWVQDSEKYGREFILVNHVFCKMKQEILLCHMCIINIHGYCHARVHASITPLYIFFSSLFWFHHVVLVDYWFLVLPFVSFATLQPFVMLQPFATLHCSLL